MIIGNAIYLGGTPLPTLNNPATNSDIRLNKQAVDGDGELLTGNIADYAGETQTGSVVPVDTGENGLFAQWLSAPHTELISDVAMPLAGYNCNQNQALKTVKLPNITELAALGFQRCPNLTGIIRLDSLSASPSEMLFYYSLRRTCVIYKHNITKWETGGVIGSLYISTVEHLWYPLAINELKYGSQAFSYNNDSSKPRKTLQFDDLRSIYTAQQFSTESTFTTLIIRTATVCTNGSSTSSGNFIVGGTGKIYVPKSLLSEYASATNWTALYNGGVVIGIDEDTTATVGTSFTPTTSATVDHWDQVDLQSYSVGTVDTTNGSITPTHDGRLLIRGLDANDEIVHVTYLQIGTGFDEEANLA